MVVIFIISIFFYSKWSKQVYSSLYRVDGYPYSGVGGGGVCGVVVVILTNDYLTGFRSVLLLWDIEYQKPTQCLQKSRFLPNTEMTNWLIYYDLAFACRGGDGGAGGEGRSGIGFHLVTDKSGRLIVSSCLPPIECPSLYLVVCVSLFVSVSLALCVCLFVCLCLYLCMSLCVPVCTSISVCVSFSLSVTAVLSVCLSVILSEALYPSLCLYVYVCLRLLSLLVRLCLCSLLIYF